jgi:hypothetical protein
MSYELGCTTRQAGGPRASSVRHLTLHNPAILYTSKIRKPSLKVGSDHKLLQYRPPIQSSPRNPVPIFVDPDSLALTLRQG